MKDFNGREFNGVKEMCKFYGVSLDTYYKRLQAGKTQKEALTSKSRRDVVDHLGNSYNRLDDMLEHYGITKNMYLLRLNRGWTLEKTLTTPRLKSNKKLKEKEMKENKDIFYEVINKYKVSKEDMEIIIDAAVKGWGQ